MFDSGSPYRGAPRPVHVRAGGSSRAHLLLAFPLSSAAAFAVADHTITCGLAELVLVGFAAAAYTHFPDMSRGRAVSCVAAVATAACARACLLAEEPGVAALHWSAAMLTLVLATVVRRGA
jgi:hypothetical protein